MIADCWDEMVFHVKVGLGDGLLDIRAVMKIDDWLAVHWVHKTVGGTAGSRDEFLESGVASEPASGACLVVVH